MRDGLDILRGLLEKFWETLYPEIEDGDVEVRVRILEWIDMRLAEMVRTFVAAHPKTDNRGARRLLNRELDACIDSLRELTNTLWEKFSDESLGFAKLRDALQGHLSGESKSGIHTCGR